MLQILRALFEEDERSTVHVKMINANRTEEDIRKSIWKISIIYSHVDYFYSLSERVGRIASEECRVFRITSYA